MAAAQDSVYSIQAFGPIRLRGSVVKGVFNIYLCVIETMKGFGRGSKTLGTPTANLDPSAFIGTKLPVFDATEYVEFSGRLEKAEQGGVYFGFASVNGC